MRKLNLYHLHHGLYGVTESVGLFLAEAAQVCLEQNGYQSGVVINVTGIHEEKIILEWDKVIDRETLLSWKDQNETVEYGATAIALGLMMMIKGYNYTRRMNQSEIGDYFLQKRGTKQSNPVNLEITGTYHNTSGNILNVRIKQKRKQINKKIKIRPKYDVLIAAVEFSNVRAKFEKL